MARFAVLFLALAMCAAYVTAADECGLNEISIACSLGLDCEPVCGQKPSDNCPIVECVAGCQCAEGYIRKEKGGECIALAVCLDILG